MFRRIEKYAVLYTNAEIRLEIPRHAAREVAPAEALLRTIIDQAALLLCNTAKHGESYQSQALGIVQASNLAHPARQSLSNKDARKGSARPPPSTSGQTPAENLPTTSMRSRIRNRGTNTQRIRHRSRPFLRHPTSQTDIPATSGGSQNWTALPENRKQQSGFCNVANEASPRCLGIIHTHTH
jgi:hypothetical protein